MTRVQGILETALYVADTARSASFYKKLFGFATLVESERLMALDVAERNVLLLFQRGATDEPAVVSGGTIPSHGSTGESHVAFSIDAGDVEYWKERLNQEDIAVESVVRWPTGTVSIYFRDLDRHLIELITPGFWAIY